MTDKMRTYIKKEIPNLHKTISKFDIYLESLFASAFMTIFSNLISIENATKVLDRFILCKIISYYNIFIFRGRVKCNGYYDTYVEE